LKRATPGSFDDLPDAARHRPRDRAVFTWMQQQFVDAELLKGKTAAN
jgi:hypothetical protein